MSINNKMGIKIGRMNFQWACCPNFTEAQCKILRLIAAIYPIRHLSALPMKNKSPEANQTD